MRYAAEKEGAGYWKHDVLSRDRNKTHDKTPTIGNCVATWATTDFRTWVVSASS